MTSFGRKVFLLLLFLVAFVTYNTMVTFRSILSYEAMSSDILDISNSPPQAHAENGVEIKVKRNKGSKEERIRIRDFVPELPPRELLAESQRRAAQIDFASIAQTWELPKGSIGILKQIQSRTIGFDYNETTDILALRHPLKTGGTSFSKMMKEIFQERVIPGSQQSGWWADKDFTNAIKEHPIHNNNDTYWSSMAVMYTHSLLRSPKRSKKKLLEELRAMVPALQKKRFRLMTIVRRPLDLAASSFYETQCRVGTFANQRDLGGRECPPVNLTDVMYKNIEFWSNKKCEGETRDTCKTRIEKKFAHCGSIDYLLDQTQNVHHKLYKDLMGDFPRPPDVVVNDTIGINLTPTLNDVSLYTLRDLGGLIDYNAIHKEDFVWFAITERFTESMCLFYYHFEIEPVKERKSL